MREFFKLSSIFARIEFWGITTIFAFAVFFFILNGLARDTLPFGPTLYKHYFNEVNMPFSFYKNYFFPQLINYVCQFFFVLILILFQIPKLLKKKTFVPGIISLALLSFLLGTVFGISSTYLKAYLYAGTSYRHEINLAIFRAGFEDAWGITSALILYSAIKSIGIYLLSKSGAIQSRYKFMRREAIAAFILWGIGILFMFLMHLPTVFIIGWMIVIPSTIVLYLTSFYSLIPRSLAYNSYQFLFYTLKSFAIITITFFVVFLVLAATIGNAKITVGLSFFNSLFQLFITVPLTWAVYKRMQRGSEEMYVLQKELWNSNANLDFLRSQINPHFLFNALNTIYGSALQENAARTSEGIQKLGDMMRFMLQENMQDKISLAQEIDYLINYITLQKLRTDAHPAIKISTHIQELVHAQIAPMLLIPFVENAFKHGISFLEPSYITISLEIKDNSLYFELANSKHIRTEPHPEKGKNNIGLVNVKQRLQLLYKEKHALVIRESAKDFFVHLTLQLT